MSVEFFAEVAQIVAAIGVIISLIYVGVQIRQATRTTKLASIQAVETAIGRTEELIIQDASFAEILRQGSLEILSHQFHQFLTRHLCFH